MAVEHVAVAPGPALDIADRLREHGTRLSELACRAVAASQPLGCSPAGTRMAATATAVSQLAGAVEMLATSALELDNATTIALEEAREVSVSIPELGPLAPPVDVDTLHDDPARWAGGIAPDLALAAGTGGAASTRRTATALEVTKRPSRRRPDPSAVHIPTPRRLPSLTLARVEKWLADGIPWSAGLAAPRARAARSLLRQWQTHHRKLEQYRADPTANDHLRLLDAAPTADIANAIVAGRIRHLETELRAFEAQLERLYEEARQ